MCIAFYFYLWICCAVLCYAKSLQSCLTLCDPGVYGLPGSSVHGILQAIVLEWVAMPSFRNPPNPGIQPTSLMSYFGRQVLYH